MAQRLFIPRLGHTMTKGIVAQWHKEQDAVVAVGDALYDLEYDKATETIEAEKAGILKHFVEEGSTLSVGEVVGVVLEPGDDLETVLAQKVYKAFVPQVPHIQASANSGVMIPVAPSDSTTAGATAEDYDADLIVIGGGPGGYVAAIRASIHGAKVILIEKDRLGGTCLNRGCIPTKALLQSAKIYTACRGAAEFGVTTGEPLVNIIVANQRKQKIVDRLVTGVEDLLKARKVEVILGVASIASVHSVTVKCTDGAEKRFTAKAIVLATGSVPSAPPIPGIGGRDVITSNEALDLSSVPSRIIIIGGGVIGMELGTIFAAFGSKVTVLEAMPEILPSIDVEIAKAFHSSVHKQMDIRTSAMVSNIADCLGGKCVTFKNGDREECVEADVVLVAVGRRPCFDGLNLDALGIKTERGYVVVDDEWCTSVPGIYCIGDANGKCMLAHAASAQGIDVADSLTGQAVDNGIKHTVIPSGIYTDPEIAAVGKTEAQLKAENIAYRVCKFNLRANGRSIILGVGGFIKILAGTEHNEILGVHIIGPSATELIGECALAMRLECTLEELADTIHLHPTVGESIMEAAGAGLFGAIHSL